MDDALYQVGLRLPPELAEAIKRAADAEERPIARQALLYVKQGLERDGYLRADDADMRKAG